MAEFNIIQFQDGNQRYTIQSETKGSHNSHRSNIFDGREQQNFSCCDQLFKKNDSSNGCDNNNSLEARLNRLETLIMTQDSESSQNNKDKTEDPLEARLKKLENFVKAKKEDNEFAARIKELEAKSGMTKQKEAVGSGEMKLLDQSLYNKSAQQPVTNPDEVKQKQTSTPAKKATKKKQPQQNEKDGWWNKSERERQKLGMSHEQYLDYRCAKEPSSASYYRKNPQDIYNDQNPKAIDQMMLDMSGVSHDKTDEIINDPDYVPYSVREMAGLNPGMFDEAAIERKDQRMAQKVKQMFGNNKPHLG